jgi:8-oxo-dGTP pyrophosphatase MutT (NUDIX family)
MYALSAVVYAERDGQILLLKRAAGALTDQFFLPGGGVDPAERPEQAAARELREETGLEIEGELELVGAYPMWVYGTDVLQLSYRGAVGPGQVRLSDEHNDSNWVDPAVLRLLLNEEFFEQLAHGDEHVLALLRHIAIDLDRYLARTGRVSPALPH